MQALACCSPYDLGLPEVSPLCEALRSGDDMAVTHLLRHGASPSGREEGNNDSIFVTIQMNSAESVHRLLQYLHVLTGIGVFFFWALHEKK